MSAAEKLKALADSATEPRSKEKLGAGLFLVDALPQIVAVTDAAERYVTARDGGKQGHLAHLRAALTALDEALP